MNKLLRLLKHGWLDERDTQRLLGQDTLARVEAHVRASERRHSGEIRICIEAGLPWSHVWQGLRARERAIELFGLLRVWDTEANNGVLIYLLLADHAIEIVADRGLARHVPPEQWQRIVADMGVAFRAGRHEEALKTAIDRVGALLQQHFALDPGAANPNELPNAPRLL